MQSGSSLLTSYDAVPPLYCAETRFGIRRLFKRSIRPRVESKSRGLDNLVEGFHKWLVESDSNSISEYLLVPSVINNSWCRVSINLPFA